MVLPVRTLLSFFVVTAVTAFVFCQPSSALAQGAPANDKFAKAEVFVVSNLPYSNVNSTTEPGEPSHNPPAFALPYHSVWFKYTPLLSGLYFLDLGGNFNTVLAVYTGTAVNKLKRVAWDDNSGINFTSQLSVYLTKGVTYHIAIGGNSESDVGQGTLDLRLSHYYTVHTYQGYIDSSDIDLDGGGKITFTTAVSSAVTGRLYLGTRSYPFTAAMTETGTFTASVPRPGQMPVTITAEPSKGSTFPPAPHRGQHRPDRRRVRDVQCRQHLLLPENRHRPGDPCQCHPRRRPRSGPDPAY